LYSSKPALAMLNCWLILVSFCFCCIKNIASSVDKDLMGIANKKLDKIIIRAALDKTNGRKNEAAILLGLGRNTLSKKMKDLGI
jgi:two-component system nitrogen regulation response regulator GlnG